MDLPADTAAGGASRAVIGSVALAESLEVVLQASPVPLKPLLAGFKFRNLGSDMLPEARRMIVLQDVREFMNDYVVDDMHRCFDKSPIEIEVLFRGA